MNLILNGMGEKADIRLRTSIRDFWHISCAGGGVEPATYFPTRQSLYDWAYQLYLFKFHNHIEQSTITVIPSKLLGSWGTMWEGTAWCSYGIASLKKQIMPAMQFVAVHEVGHLLSLDDHLGFSRCVMAWYPWFLIPLGWRNVCRKCKLMIKEVK